MPKPVLLFGYGNLSRGDDALGPLLLEYAETHCDPDAVEILSDFQLQIEHALDLENRRLVLFVDASVACDDAFGFTVLEPARDKSYTTHAMSPAAVLAVYRSIKNQTPPPCFLLSIRAEQFELGEDLSANAEANLAKACSFAGRLLSKPDFDFWLKQANAA
jgi:hydrogenase maturation protease